MQPNYLSTELDQRTNVAAIRSARQIAQSAAMAPYVKREVKPGPSMQSDEELLEFCRDNGATIFHPSGTCRMGAAQDPMAVVDAPARPRHPGASCGRLLGHADAGLGQHQRPRRHDCREGRRSDQEDAKQFQVA
jgi:choline dehydrogenase